MSKMRKRLLTEVQKEPVQYTKEIEREKNNDNNYLAIEQDIECPRCHDMMTLCSDFDRLCYLCGDCSFLLSLN